MLSSVSRSRLLRRESTTSMFTTWYSWDRPSTVSSASGCPQISCDSAASDAACDNGLYCDGVETCDAVNDCQAGTAPDCSDGVGCTDDSCDEVNDVCTGCLTDADCADGFYCNGMETCGADEMCLRLGVVPERGLQVREAAERFEDADDAELVVQAAQDAGDVGDEASGAFRTDRRVELGFAGSAGSRQATWLSTNPLRRVGGVGAKRCACAATTGRCDSSAVP